MMAVEPITLKKAQDSHKLREKRFRPSDFLTTQEMDELHESNARGKKIDRPYDEVDAFAAELLARFGWETYQAWQSGEFDMEKALRYVAAERARDALRTLPIEQVVYTATLGANNPAKGGKLPRSARKTAELLNDHIKRAKGAQ